MFDTEMILALNAAPFAGMTQTGSTGLIREKSLLRGETTGFAAFLSIQTVPEMVPGGEIC